MSDFSTLEERTRRQCEQLDGAWEVLNDATAELGNRGVQLPPDIYVSLRGAKTLISLCKTHPNLADLTPGDVDSEKGFCVACCGADIVGRIKCELRSIEDSLVLRAVNALGSREALEIQRMTMRAWQATRPLNVTP